MIFLEKSFRDVLATMDGNRGIPAIIGLHPDVRSFLANDSKTTCLKKRNKVFSFDDRKH
jgi:hypothetical protein